MLRDCTTGTPGTAAVPNQNMCTLLVSVTSRLGRRAPADPATVMSGPLLLALACALGARAACTLSLRFKAVLCPAAPALLEPGTG